MQTAKDPKFGSCPWGGDFELRWIQVDALLGAFPEGHCPNCGSRVYPPAALHRLEAALKLPAAEAPQPAPAAPQAGGQHA